MLDPYAALGLRGNPFVLDEGPAVPGWLWLDRGHSAAPEPGGRRLVQLVGEKGVGKSAHLFHWRAQRPGPYHYVPPDGPGRWAMPPFAPLVYWDEVDRMAAPVRALALWRAARAGATVAAGTHRDLSAEARRAGLAITTIALAPLTEPALLISWAERCIARAALPGAVPSLALDEATAAAILAHSASWRHAADALHVWAAGRARMKDEKGERWSERTNGYTTKTQRTRRAQRTAAAEPLNPRNPRNSPNPPISS